MIIGILMALERFKRKQLTSRPAHLWPELWKSMGKDAKLKEKQKWSNEKFHFERKLRGIYYIDPRIRKIRKPSRRRVRYWKRQLLLLCLAKL